MEITHRWRVDALHNTNVKQQNRIPPKRNKRNKINEDRHTTNQSKKPTESMKLKIKSLFFWRKDKQTEIQKAEEMLQLYTKYIPEIRKIMRDNPEDQLSDGQMVGQMYDYYNTLDDTTNNTFVMTGNSTVISSGVILPPHDPRIAATPLSVMCELETVPTPFTVENLQEKIDTLKDKSKLLNQRYAKAQIVGLTKRLENRKKYEENFKFYNSFPNTTDDKIDILIAKYKLEINTSDLFIPTFPKEAIDIMKEYSRVTKKISGETPVYYVIAEPKDFKKKREKLDPILLAQSPFGFYWQILGAWDKEMLLLSEL